MKSLEVQKSSYGTYQKSLEDTEEQVHRLTTALEDSRKECISLRKQITDV